MAITTNEYKRCHLVKMDGRVDSHTGDELHRVFKALNDEGNFKIVFDQKFG